jgi:hypothetical protein
VQIIELNSSSYLGYELKHTALHKVQRYDEAFEAFSIMFSKLDHGPDAQGQGKSHIPDVNWKVINPFSRAASAIH